MPARQRFAMSAPLRCTSACCRITKESPMCLRPTVLLPRLALSALLSIVFAPAAAAQTGLATVTGIVADQSGAAMQGVTVTATNQATNIAYTGVSNEAGNYIITGVPIGSYVIAVDAQG